MKITLITFILMVLTSFTPPDFVRNNQFLRNIFYPDQLRSGFQTGSGLGENTPGNVFDHSDFAYILKKYVNEKGFVNYTGLSNEEVKLDEYLALISEADYDKLSRYEKLAFLINAYNAFTLKLIIQHPGISSIKDIPSGKRWKYKAWDLAGKKVSLDTLEHERIRGEFGEPRIHFALVCAAVSCPELRQEPYTGEKLTSQLVDQAKQFFSDEQNFRWDKTSEVVYLSELMDWYRYDFADNEKGLLRYITSFIEHDSAEEIKKRLDSVDIKYLSYDWSLNGNWK